MFSFLAFSYILVKFLVDVRYVLSYLFAQWPDSDCDLYIIGQSIAQMIYILNYIAIRQFQEKEHPYF